MENHLENIYKEEYVRSKARNDYEKYLAQKNFEKKKRKKYFIALGYSVLGIGILYILYEIYTIFI